MRRALRVAGVAAIVCGFAAALGEWLDWLSAPRLAVSLLALSSLLLGFVHLVDRHLSEAERATPPAVERGYRVPVPGDRIDRDVERGTSIGLVKRRLTERVRVSLEERGASREEAARAIERGTWTEDRIAVAFLSSTGRTVPLSTRFVWWLRGESTTERCVSRTVLALAAIREGASRE